MWTPLVILAVAFLSVGSADDEPRCQLQIEGGFTALMAWTSKNRYIRFDPVTGDYLQDLQITWDGNQYVMNSGYATIGAPEGTADVPQENKCLPDGAVVKLNGEIVARVWRLKAPYYSTCPIRFGRPRLNAGTEIAYLDTNCNSLRDCLEKAASPSRETYTALIYEEKTRHCIGVVGQTKFDWYEDGKATWSCAYGYVPFAGWIVGAEGLPTSEELGNFDTFKECAAEASKRFPDSVGASLINGKCKAITGGQYFEAMNVPDPDDQGSYLVMSSFNPSNAQPPV